MKISVSIGFLLVSASFVPVSIANDDKNHERTEISDDQQRWKSEMEDFEVGYMIIRDDGYLEKLTKSNSVSTDATPIVDKIHFYLSTREGGQITQKLVMDYNSDTHLRNTHFDAGKPTIFITHGWKKSHDSAEITRINSGYITNYDVNVIVVDWSEISNAPYFWTCTQVEAVGIHVSKMIDYMQEKANLNTSQTTLVGHSLGAHVMGIAGHHAKGTIKAIFGLDPSYQGFKHAEASKRLSSDDAAHVQVIHTNGGYLGIWESIGDSDYYVNGGSSQLGCNFAIMGACSHARAWEYFAESLDRQSTKHFRGHKCSDMVEVITGMCQGETASAMGGLDPTATGMFFVLTSRSAPYALDKIES